MATTLALSSQVFAEPGFLDDYAVFGVAGDGHLKRYDFASGDYHDVGHVRLDSLTPLAGIEGSAHVPGNLNIFSFWTEPSSNQTKLIFINSETAEAAVVGQPLGIGQVTGATISWKDQEGEMDEGGDTITGLININPNNSSDNEFVLTKLDGTKITRDDLHKDATLTGDTYFEGDAMYLRVKPKGSGSQFSLSVEGLSYSIDNDKTYVLSGGQMHVRIYNDHIAGGKAMGHWWIDVMDSGSAVIHEGDGDYGYTGLFALQKVEAAEDDFVDFAISSKKVVPSEPFAAKVRILGAAITAGGAYDIPVTVKLKIGDVVVMPFGDFSKAVTGNVNDDGNPRTYILPSVYPANTSISVIGQSWSKKASFYSGKSDSHWLAYLNVGPSSSSGNLLVLRNGDSVPAIPAFDDQSSILDFIRDYVDVTTGTVILDENQAIFLYELGTTSLTSPAADFQDLVILVTLGHTVEELQEDEDDDNTNVIASRIVKVNTQTGGAEQIMTLNRVYDGLAATPQGIFLGTFGSQLYVLDPFNQTETLVGTLPNSDMKGFEAAGTTYCGFTTVNDELVPIDITTGAALAPGMGIVATDLRTIIFMDKTKMPSGLASFD